MSVTTDEQTVPATTVAPVSPCKQAFNLYFEDQIAKGHVVRAPHADALAGHILVWAQLRPQLGLAPICKDRKALVAIIDQDVTFWKHPSDEPHRTVACLNGVLPQFVIDTRAKNEAEAAVREEARAPFIGIARALQEIRGAAA